MYRRNNSCARHGLGWDLLEGFILVCHHLMAKRPASMQTCTRWCALLSRAGAGVRRAPRLCCPSWRGPGRAPRAGLGDTSTVSALRDPPGSSCSEPAPGLSQRGGRGRRPVGHRLPLGEVARAEPAAGRHHGSCSSTSIRSSPSTLPAGTLPRVRAWALLCSAPARLPAALTAPSPPARSGRGVLRSPSQVQLRPGANSVQTGPKVFLAPSIIPHSTAPRREEKMKSSPFASQSPNL